MLTSVQRIKYAHNAQISCLKVLEVVDHAVLITAGLDQRCNVFVAKCREPLELLDFKFVKSFKTHVSDLTGLDVIRANDDECAQSFLVCLAGQGVELVEIHDLL